MEYLDVVNDNDEVVGEISRRDLYTKLLTHRIVHVLVFNKKEELALQLRSNKMSYRPLHWSTSAGGHVQKGESYEQAAKRELKEECGIDGDLELLFKEMYTGEQGVRKFLGTFKLIVNESFDYKNDEVDRIEFFSIDKIKEMILSGEKIHPELKFIINNHF